MNYEDPRIQRLEEEKNNKLTDNNTLYDNMISDNQKMLDEQNSWQDAYLQQQNELFDRSTGLITDKLNQGKKAVDESYQKEALASESSYQDFINPYGIQAEQQATTGMTNTGYSESTKATAYNTARIRTALARSAKIKAETEYDNQIKEAQLSNDSQKANLALEILKEKLANRLNAFQTELNLKQNKINTQTDIDNTYYNRYQDVFNQQNYEKEQAENLRRWQEEFNYQKEQDAIRNAQNWQQVTQKQQAQAEEVRFTETQNQYNANANKVIENIENLKRLSKTNAGYGSIGSREIANIVNKAFQDGLITEDYVYEILDRYGIK